MGNTCGGIREPCLSDVDPRYDPTSAFGLIEQDDIWRRNAGLFELVGKTYDGNGTEMGLQDVGGGLILDAGTVTQYTNITVDGTRLSYESHIYMKNGYGNQYPGFGQKLEVYGYATHELDGRMVTLPDAADPDGANQVTYVVGDDTTFAVGGVSENEETGGKEFGTISRTCLDEDCAFSSEVHQNYREGVLFNFRVYSVRKMEEAEFLSAKEATEADTNVADIFLEGLNSAPGSLYPPEEVWCEGDPSCSPSPYKNPTTPIKSSYIALVVILGAVLALGLFAAAHRWLSKRKERRLRTLFAERIAQTVQIRTSPDQLSPELLEKEFQEIDKNNDGRIQKDEMWEFLGTGKAGTVGRSDFDALWAVLDADGSGGVDFLEFCGFLGKCHVEYDVARNSRAVIARWASRALGSQNQLAVEDPDEGGDEGEGEGVPQSDPTND